jgi:hypothetical protein
MKRSHSKVINAFIILFVLGVHSSIAQSFQRFTHVGFEGSVGIHGLRQNNKRLEPVTKGVSVGFVIGNNLLKARVRPLGFYYSSTRQHVDFTVLESQALINFYPLEFFRTSKQRLDLYVCTGISFNRFKNHNLIFRQKDSPELVAPAEKKAKYLGQLTGFGIECHLPHGFAHIFAEVMFSNLIYTTSDTQAVNGILSELTPAINFGLRIGHKKLVKTRRVYPG